MIHEEQTKRVPRQPLPDRNRTDEMNISHMQECDDENCLECRRLRQWYSGCQICGKPFHMEDMYYIEEEGYHECEKCHA